MQRRAAGDVVGEHRPDVLLLSARDESELVIVAQRPGQLHPIAKTAERQRGYRRRAGHLAHPRHRWGHHGRLSKRADRVAIIAPVRGLQRRLSDEIEGSVPPTPVVIDEHPLFEGADGRPASKCQWLGQVLGSEPRDFHLVQ